MEDSRKMRVAVYCRLATKQQDTLNAQVEMMKQYVASHPNWELAKVYCDVCPSARLSQRIGFAHLLHDARGGQFTVVAIPKPSRLAKSMLHFTKLQKKLEDAGICVDYADGSHTTGVGELMRMLKVLGE